MQFIIHIESVTRYKCAAISQQFDYVQAIVARYKPPCRSYLVLLTTRGVSKKLPPSTVRTKINAAETRDVNRWLTVPFLDAALK